MTRMTRADHSSDLGKNVRTQHAFLDFARTVKSEIDRALPPYFDALEKESATDPLAGDVAPVMQALRALVERGGKRLRGVLLAAAYEGSRGADRASILPALVSFELLQGYLLTHDDWIDDDDVRRGGPTVHAALRKTFDSPRDAEIFAVLAGDYAAALSLRALSSCAVSEARIARATRAMGDMLRNVVLGQMYDVRGTVERQGANMRAAIDRVYELKTASYTVVGPVIIGATLAGATDSTLRDLALAARPLGIMFQLKDDLLGVFGDPSVTGKSASSDLLQGKFTALIVEAANDPNVALDLARLRKMRADKADKNVHEDVDALVTSLRQRIAASGARSRVEERIAKLFDEATVAIEKAELTDQGKELLLGAAALLGGRNQ